MSSLRPFDLEYTPQFAQLLSSLDISLVLSTYQAGKVIVLSPVDGDKLVQLPRTFANAMGMACSGEKLAVATEHTVEVLQNNSSLAKDYPNKKGLYDSLFLPRVTYHTGHLALHDMAFVGGKLMAANTLYSCIAQIDEKASFTPLWQPPFITELAPEDRCHLNGLAVQNNQIRYVTALGHSNNLQGWRENKINGGILMEYPSGRIILDKLGMPHSPRFFNGKLYVLNSAQGQLLKVDTFSGRYEVILDLGSFVRGMAMVGEYLFIGSSKLRHNSQVFRDLPIARTSFAGVIAVHLPYRSVVGYAKYKMSVDEIYDVKILEGKTRPNILSPDMDILKNAIVYNHKSIWQNYKKKDDEDMELETPQNNEKTITYQYLKALPAKEILDKFEPLLCDEIKNLIKEQRLTSYLNMAVALNGNQPVGLVTFEARHNSSATINSVFVKENFRKQYIGTNLITLAVDILEKNNIKTIQTRFDKSLVDDFMAVTKLFAKFPMIDFDFI